mgnify:CR=1 FL=1
MIHDSTIPFYQMNSTRNYTLDKCPSNKQEVIKGIQKAIEATKKRMGEYKKDRADTSELDTHLKSLENWLEREKRK